MKNKNVDFKSFVVWVKRISDLVFELSSVQSRQFETQASYYPSTTHEPSWLKSIVKFNSQKVIFGAVHLGVGFRGVGTPRLCKKIVS